MGVKSANFWERVRSTYWFLPAVMAVTAIVLSFVTIAIDEAVQTTFIEAVGVIWAGGPEGARGLLSTVASSMLSVAGVTFSITIATLSLASSQFGPHLLRNFMRDTSNQVVFGTFVATFIYCLLVLRTVRGDNDDQFVPYISVTLSILLALAGSGVLIYFIHHIAMSIQAPNVIATVNHDLEQAINQLFPREIGHEAPQQQNGDPDLPEGFERDAYTIAVPRNGYVQAVDGGGLLQLARKHDLLLRLEHRPGHFIIAGSTLVRAWPAERVNEDIARQISAAFIVGRQNTLTQDVGFAIDQMVQIAVRSLSPGINDPFTAIICVDWLGAALSRLVNKEFPLPYRYDDEGKLRVIANSETLTGLIDAAFNQIRQNALSRSSVAVIIHLLDTIKVVATHIVDEAGYAALRRHTEMIIHSIRQELPEGWDRANIEERYRAAARVLEQCRSRLQDPGVPPDHSIATVSPAPDSYPGRR